MTQRTRRKIEELERENRRLERNLDSANLRIKEYERALLAAETNPSDTDVLHSLRRAIIRRAETDRDPILFTSMYVAYMVTLGSANAKEAWDLIADELEKRC